jgi:hypothetical protein
MVLVDTSAWFNFFLTSLAIGNSLPTFSLDRHFEDLSRLTGLTLWS